MPFETDKRTAPAYWASYLINGDASGITDEDKAQADDWTARLSEGGWYVVSTTDEEAWFAWYNDALPGRLGCDIVSYVLHRGATVP